MKKIKNMLIFIFGKQVNTRYERIIILVCIIIISFMVAQNLSCEFNIGNFKFNWNPAAEIKINK